MIFQITYKQPEDQQQIASSLKRLNTFIVTPDLPQVSVQLPPAYGGPSDEAGRPLFHSPEDLFLGAIAGCFFTTFSVVSTNSHFSYISLDIKAKGTMGVVDETKLMSTIEQDITLTIPREASERKALKILEISEQRCPLANSAKSEIKNRYHIIYQSQ